MSSKNKDLGNLVEAYNTMQAQQIDEKGGFWDKQLARSPIAKMFGGVSDRAQSRVQNKQVADNLKKMFNRTLGGNKQPVDVGQVKEFGEALKSPIAGTFAVLGLVVGLFMACLLYTSDAADE